MRRRTWVLGGASALGAALVTGEALGGSGATSLAERHADRDGYAVVRMDDTPFDSPAPVDPRQEELSEPVDVPPPPRAVAADFAVLHDEPWTVEEGVWHLGPEGAFPLGDLTGLLSLDRRAAGVSFFGPALYGRYDLRVERHPAEPPVPGWCGDVVEVSLPHDDAGLQMGSFESWSATWAVPQGDLRVRWCAEDLDVVARETAEDEFDGDDYRLYSGRQLVQLWAAPLSDPSVVRLRSAFAKDVERS